MTANAPRYAETAADMLHNLGDISPSRVRLCPFPATEADVLRIHAKEGRLFELVEGILVEKAMGMRESMLASYIITLLSVFVHPRRLGIITAPDGMLKLSVGLIRIPDVSFISWDDIPGGKVPKEPVPMLAPTLAVEVLSESNTLAEMKRKRREYFKAGSSLMWVVDPKDRTVTVYSSFKKFRVLEEADTLDGGKVLPGFKLPLAELFAILDAEAP